MIEDKDSGKEYLNSIRDGSFIYGLSIDCDLDKHLRYKQGTFNVFAGHSNVGKTKLILYYYLCLAVKHNKKFLMFSTENSIGGLKRDLIQLHASKKVEDMSEQDFEYYFYWVNEYFSFVDFESFYKKNNRFMNFRDVFKTALTDCKYFDALVIDPYNSLATVDDIKGNAHERDYSIAQEFRMFCKVNNKSIYLLAHGNTEALRKVYPREHDFKGHPIPLMAADIEGGGKWVNRADDFVVIHRLTQHESEWMKTEVHIRKIKETETGGATTFMDSPIIFQMAKDSLGFNCYTRQLDYTNIPHTAVNPLQKKDKPQPKQEELKMTPSKEFDIKKEEPKKIIPKFDIKEEVEDEWFNEKEENF